ncbi:hypothetical protein BpHYR1_022484 [Brachionus plicatilis]|uniref:Uncharacterized protein n=1 Tax=Brachionus plicatilis TaxID=10195 RepID=A0A3M7PZI1_BRAPC|nr:hypothetical protein BpHYR1_022484 [Brachionus plicatilis]
MLAHLPLCLAIKSKFPMQKKPFLARDRATQTRLSDQGQQNDVIFFALKVVHSADLDIGKTVGAQLVPEFASLAKIHGQHCYLTRLIVLFD